MTAGTYEWVKQVPAGQGRESRWRRRQLFVKGGVELFEGVAMDLRVRREWRSEKQTDKMGVQRQQRGSFRRGRKESQQGRTENQDGIPVEEEGKTGRHKESVRTGMMTMRKAVTGERSRVQGQRLYKVEWMLSERSCVEKDNSG